MITIEDINNKTFAYNNKIEMNKSESSLKGSIQIETKVRCEPVVKYRLVLVPYQNYNDKFNHYDEVKKNDIFEPFHTPQYIEQGINKILFTEDDNIIHLNKIPKQYNFIDFFVFPQEILGSNLVHYVSLNFVQKKIVDEQLFGYERYFYSCNMHGIFLGILGKVSDGWKFYPKFYDTMMNQKKILSLAIGGYYD